MMQRLFMLLCLTFLPTLLQAADIYQWTDETGRAHMSDAVPEKYRKTAKRMGLPSTSAAQTQEDGDAARKAQERARATRAATETATKRQLPDETQAAAPAADADAAPTETNCEERWRIYKESLECFAPFYTKRGTVRAEAFEHCTAVPNPSMQCGTPYKH